MEVTFSNRDVFTTATVVGAMSYIGKKGYFADSIAGLYRAIDENCIGKLEDVFLTENIDQVFKPVGSTESYGLFLPEDKLKPVLKDDKYRPYETIEEFRKALNLNFGDSICFRHKYDFNINVMAVFTAYGTKEDKLLFVNLGGFLLEPEELLEKYEYFDEYSEDWHPFGMEK